jgi:hypothetical protein
MLSKRFVIIDELRRSAGYTPSILQSTFCVGLCSSVLAQRQVVKFSQQPPWSRGSLGHEQRRFAANWSTTHLAASASRHVSKEVAHVLNQALKEKKSQRQDVKRGVNFISRSGPKFKGLSQASQTAVRGAQETIPPFFVDNAEQGRASAVERVSASLIPDDDKQRPHGPSHPNGPFEDMGGKKAKDTTLHLHKGEQAESYLELKPHSASDSCDARELPKEDLAREETNEEKLHFKQNTVQERLNDATARTKTRQQLLEKRLIELETVTAWLLTTFDSEFTPSLILETGQHQGEDGTQKSGSYGGSAGGSNTSGVFPLRESNKVWFRRLVDECSLNCLVNFCLRTVRGS